MNRPRWCFRCFSWSCLGNHAQGEEGSPSPPYRPRGRRPARASSPKDYEDGWALYCSTDSSSEGQDNKNEGKNSVKEQKDLVEPEVTQNLPSSGSVQEEGETFRTSLPRVERVGNEFRSLTGWSPPLGSHRRRQFFYRARRNFNPPDANTNADSQENVNFMMQESIPSTSAGFPTMSANERFYNKTETTIPCVEAEDQVFMEEPIEELKTNEEVCGSSLIDVSGEQTVEMKSSSPSHRTLATTSKEMDGQSTMTVPNSSSNPVPVEDTKTKMNDSGNSSLESLEDDEVETCGYQKMKCGSPYEKPSDFYLEDEDSKDGQSNQSDLALRTSVTCIGEPGCTQEHPVIDSAASLTSGQESMGDTDNRKPGTVNINDQTSDVEMSSVGTEEPFGRRFYRSQVSERNTGTEAGPSSANNESKKRGMEEDPESRMSPAYKKSVSNDSAPCCTNYTPQQGFTMSPGTGNPTNMEIDVEETARSLLNDLESSASRSGPSGRGPPPHSDNTETEEVQDMMSPCDTDETTLELLNDLESFLSTYTNRPRVPDPDTQELLDELESVISQMSAQRAYIGQTTGASSDDYDPEIFFTEEHQIAMPPTSDTQSPTGTDPAPPSENHEPGD